MLCYSHRQWTLSALLAFMTPLAALALNALYPSPSCELCSLLRSVFVMVGTLFLILSLSQFFPSKKHIRQGFQAIIFFFCFIGFVISSRQVFLQYQSPPLHQSCAPSLNYLLENFGAIEIIQKLWEGGTSCQKMDIQFFGLSLAVYAVFLFALLGISSLYYRCCQD